MFYGMGNGQQKQKKKYQKDYYIEAYALGLLCWKKYEKLMWWCYVAQKRQIYGTINFKLKSLQNKCFFFISRW